jgi:hypothetical protein
MQLRLAKKGGRCRLTCVRTDGSWTAAELGPGLPYHDLAHFVIERAFGLEHGFFGHVAIGHSLQELSSKEAIQALPPESWVAEILARALGSLATGACTPEQFSALVEEELTRRQLPAPPQLSQIAPVLLLAEYRELLDRYDALSSDASLDLRFEPTARSGATHT